MFKIFVNTLRQQRRQQQQQEEEQEQQQQYQQQQQLVLPNNMNLKSGRNFISGHSYNPITSSHSPISPLCAVASTATPSALESLQKSYGVTVGDNCM